MIRKDKKHFKETILKETGEVLDGKQTARVSVVDQEKQKKMPFMTGIL